MLRGFSRAWCFAYAGGFAALTLGAINFSIAYVLNVFLFGYFITNSYRLMAAMGKLDKYEKKAAAKDVLDDLRKQHWADVAVMFAVAVCAFAFGYTITALDNSEVILFSNWRLLLGDNTVSHFLVVLSLGAAAGLIFSVGRLVALLSYYLMTLGQYVRNSESASSRALRTLFHSDELAVLGYGRHWTHLRESAHDPTRYQQFLEESSWYLANSPFSFEISRDIGHWFGEQDSRVEQKLETLLLCRVDSAAKLLSQIISTDYPEPQVRAEIELLYAVVNSPSQANSLILNHLRATTQEDIYSGSLRRLLRKWESLMPEHTGSKKLWEAALTKRTKGSHLNARGDESPTLKDHLEKQISIAVQAEAQVYFSRRIPNPFRIDWGRQIYYWKERRSSVQVKIHNTSNMAIGFSEFKLSFTPEKPRSITYEIKNRRLARLERGMHQVLEADIEAKTLRRQQIEACLELHYSAVANDKGESRPETWKSVETLSFQRARAFREVDSPYTRDPVRTRSQLFGRDALLNKIISGVKSCRGGYITIHGERRIGKTSILLVLEEILCNLGMRAIYFDAQSLTGSDYASKDPVLAFLQRLHSKTVSTYARAGVPGTKGDLLGRDDFSDRHSGSNLVFLIDEFDVFLSRLGKNHNFFDLRGYEESGIILVLSFPLSSYQSIRINNPALSNSLFGKNVYPVGPLDSDAIRRLIQEPVQGFLDFEPAAIESMITLTGGFPIYVQALCQEMVDYVNEKTRSTVVSRDDVENCVAISKGTVSLPLLMKGLLDQLTKPEISLLKYLKANGGRMDLVEIKNRRLGEEIEGLERYHLLKKHAGHVTCTARFILEPEILDSWAGQTSVVKRGS